MERRILVKMIFKRPANAEFTKEEIAKFVFDLETSFNESSQNRLHMFIIDDEG